MDFTITVGWWIAPALFTVIALFAAFWYSPRMEPGGMFPDFGAVLLSIIYIALAIILSLIAWGAYLIGLLTV